MLRKAYYKLIFYKELQMIPATRNKTPKPTPKPKPKSRDITEDVDSLPPMV